jgi:hypothetical protein
MLGRLRSHGKTAEWLQTGYKFISISSRQISFNGKIIIRKTRRSRCCPDLGGFGQMDDSLV